MKVDGTDRVVHPENGDQFTLEEMQALVGGLIEFVRPRNQHGVSVWVNEEGMLLDLPFNPKLSKFCGIGLVGDGLVTFDADREVV